MSVSFEEKNSMPELDKAPVDVARSSNSNGEKEIDNKMKEIALELFQNEVGNMSGIAYYQKFLFSAVTTIIQLPLTVPMAIYESCCSAKKQIALKLVAPKCSFWKPRNLSIETAFPKMWKNSLKAIEEHKATEKVAEPLVVESIYASLQEAYSSDTSASPVNFKCSVDENISLRKKMQDAHFYMETEDSIIAAIFDGHGTDGEHVAKFAAKQCHAQLSALLAENRRKFINTIHSIFEKTIDQIHEEVKKNSKWDDQGCTALVCFIDKKTRLLYTATLGDSEATSYVKVAGKMKALPHSVVRCWGSQKDALRAAVGQDDPQIAKEWPVDKYPKELRWDGINVSRSIGDVGRKGERGESIVIQKPKITIGRLQKDSVLVLACDGLKDYISENVSISENVIIEQIGKHQVSQDKGKNLANRLVTASYNKQVQDRQEMREELPRDQWYDASDNITVIAIEII